MRPSTRVREHIRANVVGYLALFLVLTGGTAQALSGSDTVFSDDIVNQQVRSNDVANDTSPFALQGIDIANNSLTGSDIANAVSGSDDVNADLLDGQSAGAFAAAAHDHDQLECATVAASESTTSTTATDLATPGPSVTVDVPPEGVISVYASAQLQSVPTPSQAVIDLAEQGFAMGGILAGGSAGPDFRATAPGAGLSGSPSAFNGGWLTIPPGQIAPGTRTISLKYRVINAGNTGTFANRLLCVASFG